MHCGAEPEPKLTAVPLVAPASGVNLPDTRIFDGAAALGTTSDGQRRVSRPGFNFNHDNEGNNYVARSTCN